MSALFSKTESELQEKLKQFCDSKGREVESHETGFIFNELGLLYKTLSPNRISLIRSAALLNAAIVRQPDNQKFQDDLDQLCKHVLECANAKKKDAKLVEISQTAANQIKKMRNQVDSKLHKIKKIPENLSDKEKQSEEKAYVEEVKTANKCVNKL